MKNEAAQIWIEQALHDLDMAKKNLEVGGYDVAAFLAQQCVEKLLKAALILEGKKPPKTHYIDVLAQIVEVPQEIFEQILPLTTDYLLARYPDVMGEPPYRQYTRSIAESRIQAAETFWAYFQERWL